MNGPALATAVRTERSDMTPAKRIICVLAVSATATVPAAWSHPAGADPAPAAPRAGSTVPDARPSPKPTPRFFAAVVNPPKGHTPAYWCAYRVIRVRPTSHLNVRSGPGLDHPPIAALAPGDRSIPGACSASRGWIQVRTPGGKPGFASARYLRRVIPLPAPGTYDFAGCSYRVTGVRPTSHLNVRRGPGLDHPPIATLPAGGRVIGGCGAQHGWIPVRSADGVPGWAAASFLRRTAAR
ncbi:hypothetical protein TBS_32980 [Thermobispora bispora]